MERYRPGEHEPLAGAPSDEERARRAIADIVADAERLGIPVPGTRMRGRRKLPAHRGFRRSKGWPQQPCPFARRRRVVRDRLEEDRHALVTKATHMREQRAATVARWGNKGRGHGR